MKTQSYIESFPCDEPNLLRRRLDEHGYLFVRGLLSANDIEQVRAAIVQILVNAGWLENSSLTSCAQGVALRDTQQPYREVIEQILRLEYVHQLIRRQPFRDLLTHLLKCNLFVHPRLVPRVSFPSLGGRSFSPHQDFPEIQGSSRTLTVWFPLTECPVSLGALGIAPGSHVNGVLALDVADTGSGMVTSVVPELVHVGDLEEGDVLVFGPYTVHGSFPNVSDRLKITIDFRVQPSSDCICETCLSTPDWPFSLQDLADEWEDEELRSTWAGAHMSTVPYNPEFDIMRDAEAIRRAESGDAGSGVLRCLTYAMKFSRNATTRDKAAILLNMHGIPDGIQLWTYNTNE